jgi:CRISPR-associated protein Cas2
VAATQLWIVAYDSPSDSRRRRLAQLLEGYGQRLQWSVFACHLRTDQLRALTRHLEHCLDPSQDRVCCWPVAAQQMASIVVLGLPQLPTETGGDFIL